MELKLIFGADPATPHNQYVLMLSNRHAVRFIPWKCQNETVMNTVIAHRAQEHSIIPGYTIIMLVQILDEKTGAWINVTKASGACFDAFTEQAKEAAQFYLTYKIAPYAKKFSRYRADKQA